MENAPARPIALDFKNLFQLLPGLYIILSPELIVLAASDQYLKVTQSTRAQLVGRNLFDSFPENPDAHELKSRASVEASLQHVLTHREPHELRAQRYDLISQDGSYESRYWHISSTPALDAAGAVQYIIHEVREVTSQVMAEQEKQESTERFQRIAMASNDVIWDWNLRNDSIWWNDGYRKLFGYPTKAGMTITSWTDFIHPEDAVRIHTSIHKVIDGNTNYWEGEYRFRGADGSYKVIYDKGSVIRDAAGKPIRMVGAMLDITARRQHEQQLQESLAWSRTLLESLPLMTWTAQPNGRIDYGNQSWHTYTGTSHQDLADYNISHLLHPDDAATTLQAWDEALAQGQTFVTECRWKSALDGLYRWFLVRAVPIRDEQDQITHWIGTQTDIENQKQMLLAMQEINERFQFLAESIPQIVWSARPSGDADYVNQRWYDYSGMSAQQTQEQGWLPAIHPDYRQRFIDSWRTSISSGEPYYMEVPLRNVNSDSHRWHMARALPMRNAEGAIVKWFGTCTDIEDHKKAEEELVEKNLELERINHDLDSFVYSASHDLKLPIINMAGIYAELMRTAVFSDPEAPKMMEMFDKALQQIHNTIQDLTDVVRVQRTRSHKLESVDLKSLAEEVLLSLQDMIQETEARIELDFAAVPSLQFTRANLNSILFNLISNGIKYRIPNRPPELRLRTQLKGDYVELEVKDNGLGIDMNKHQSKLFQMFKRFHNHVSGSGLGLYIVNRLLTNHGGYINIDSNPDEGTTFYLYFKQKKQ
ncbi:PAS domain-containing protein [Pontibacter sp. E15-1]|uniref:PAS domain-containing sensor histidine kinase n=1 Tax=Pontibacter sp. E15-1 TaxID=2919918 RepID=UPI001F4FC424|nr:PAS domain-containing protein [Pontibacter sp. E15-1]MCJ8165495.1 PAS domain-containing protein [Pontibacter sp. E15-1]